MILSYRASCSPRLLGRRRGEVRVGVVGVGVIGVIVIIFGIGVGVILVLVLLLWVLLLRAPWRTIVRRPLVVEGTSSSDD